MTFIKRKGVSHLPISKLILVLADQPFTDQDSVSATGVVLCFYWGYISYVQDEIHIFSFLFYESFDVIYQDNCLFSVLPEFM